MLLRAHVTPEKEVCSESSEAAVSWMHLRCFIFSLWFPGRHLEPRTSKGEGTEEKRPEDAWGDPGVV